MSQRYNNGSHWENHQKAAELHEAAAHAHRSAAENRGEQEHLTGQEHSRQALEHSRIAYERSLGNQDAEQTTGQNGHGIATFGHEEIAKRAHEIWIAKGRPQGSAEADWFQAAKELRSRATHTA
jgi:hypothetical protein